MKIDELSAAELSQLEAEIVKRKKQIEKERVGVAAKEIGAVLSAHGVTLAEVLPHLQKKTGPKSKAPAKYRNPADASQTWTGRGRKPNWMAAGLKKGKKLEDFAI